MMKHFIHKIWQVLVKSFKDFMADGALKYSASLSYYTVFSIAPVLIIIIGITGLFFGREAVSGQIYYQFSDLMGTKVAQLIQDAIQNIELEGQSMVATVVGFVTLLVGASGVFAELQDSLNKIWSVKATAQNGWLKYLINRLISFSMVLTLGFLLIVSLLINALISLLSNHLLPALSEWQWLSLIINNIIIIVIVTLLFAFIFKFLPDVKLKWTDVLSGAFFTALLFFLGKYLIGTYLSQSAIASAFGAAGSLALILLWVYYSSAILFFGAEFTKNYALISKNHVEPDDYAAFVLTKEKELNSGTDICEVEDQKNKEEDKKKKIEDKKNKEN